MLNKTVLLSPFLLENSPFFIKAFVSYAYFLQPWISHGKLNNFTHNCTFNNYAIALLMLSTVEDPVLLLASINNKIHNKRNYIYRFTTH
jgi:hypothetical protein